MHYYKMLVCFLLLISSTLFALPMIIENFELTEVQSFLLLLVNITCLLTLLINIKSNKQKPKTAPVVNNKPKPKVTPRPVIKRVSLQKQVNATSIKIQTKLQETRHLK